MGGIPYVVTAVSPCSGWDLPHVVTAENLATAYLIRIGWFSICYHFCALSTVCDFPHVVTCFSNNSRCYFPCVATAHLISSGWISICCQCSFMMLFFLPNAVQFVFHVLSLHTCFHFKNQWMQFFLLVSLHTAYLVTIERFSICVAPTVSAHCIFSKH